MALPQEQTSSAPTAPSPRLHFIDGLRAMAMLSVLLFHCDAYSGGWHSPGNLLAFVGYGHVGVNLFLVLSGFCLYWPYVKTAGRPEPTLWQFAKKRGRRILPPYYAALVLFWAFLLWDVLTHHHWHEDATSTTHVVKSLFWHLTMLYNLRPEYIESINGPFWSLALEFSLYITFPILVEAFRRYGILRPLVTVLVINIAFRTGLAVLCPADTLTGQEQFTLYYSLWGRCFEFVIGMAAACFVARRSRRALFWAGPAFGMGVIGAVLTTQRCGLFSALPDVFWGIGFASLIVLASRPRQALNACLSHPWAVRLGTCSYSIYLVHQPLVKAMVHVAAAHHWPAVPFGVLIVVPSVFVIGYGFHLLFEKPFMTPPRPRTAALAGKPTILQAIPAAVTE